MNNQRECYSGQSKRTKYREIAEKANVIKQQLHMGKMDSFDSDAVNLRQETQNKIQDPNTQSATLDNPNFSTSDSFFFNTDNNSSSDINLSSDSDCEIIAPNLTEQLHLWSQ
ncbi:hypothetical protein AVEN_146674-1 [Araneus ventricosus]|uniref:Uncharacterized protein n=1 Tax=Araneus ventricosus TaxID=182803 RepID=A0A4Y2KMU8_ARAVE|nr:hypothetical protein AVEN_146674-1 [Araneus ventricosus]